MKRQEGIPSHAWLTHLNRQSGQAYACIKWGTSTFRPCAYDMIRMAPGMGLCLEVPQPCQICLTIPWRHEGTSLCRQPPKWTGGWFCTLQWAWALAQKGMNPMGLTIGLPPCTPLLGAWNKLSCLFKGYLLIHIKRNMIMTSNKQCIHRSCIWFFYFFLNNA